MKTCLAVNISDPTGRSVTMLSMLLQFVVLGCGWQRSPNRHRHLPLEIPRHQALKVTLTAHCDLTSQPQIVPLSQPKIARLA
jgi:hypothetical protein